MIEFLSMFALMASAIPAALYLLNHAVYRRLPQTTCAPILGRAGERAAVSVLIPARNEEQNIAASLRAALENRDLDLEIIVLDDHSTDRTAEIVRALAARDPRVRLESAPPLPAGWCGKQHACHILAGHARHEFLLFIDADVRLEPGSIRRMARFMQASGADLASGVPRQILGTFSERLLLPLIHFVLLGYLPMHLMRWTKLAGFSAGCGQLFLARARAYRTAGGHAMIRATLHDGVKLPRLFRRAGFKTDLFDATDLAACRMYQTNAETWRGLGKNATEGLAAPGTILPMTALLLGGQVLPFALLAAAPFLPLGPRTLSAAALAAAFSLLPRLIAARQFRQPCGSALLHPFGVLALVAIQWAALFRKIRGRPSEWKGRAYHLSAEPRKTASHAAPHAACSLLLGLFAAFLPALFPALRASPPSPSSSKEAPPLTCPSFSLEDQHGVRHDISFPRAKPTVLLIADGDGSKSIDRWKIPIKEKRAGQVEFAGVADVSSVPGFLKGKIRRMFQEKMPYPVMLDWEGAVLRPLDYHKGQVNVLILDPAGRVRHRAEGLPTESQLAAIDQLLGQMLAAASPSSEGASEK